MSEHWKSTPKYWCKHCSCYVRDTKLEKQNHESTARHQGSIKRSLRELHRGHERAERDKERARREIDRLNGVVPSSSGPSSTFASSNQNGGNHAGLSSEAQLKRQMEQLAELGVAVPNGSRPEMAMAGEWTVTNTRVIETKPELLSGPEEEEEKKKVEAKATGIRKREVTEEQIAEEEAVSNLSKRPRHWGRATKTMPEDEDAELEALLSGSLPVKVSADSIERAKEEPIPDGALVAKAEDEAVKQEDAAAVSTEDNQLLTPNDPIKPEDSVEEAPVAAVVFKKRKPKGIRQK